MSTTPPIYNPPDDSQDSPINDLAYGGGTDNQQNYRLWRIERGTAFKRAGSQVQAQAAVGNPTIYGKVSDSALTNGSIDPSASGFLAAGPVPPTVAAPNFSFTANSTTQLIISWPYYASRRMDGTAIVLPSGQIQIDNLVANTKFRFYPYWSEAAKSIGWVNGGTGTPAIGFSGFNDLNIQTQNLQGHFTFGVISFTMPAAGSSSGSTGGSGGDGSSGGGDRTPPLVI